MSAQERQPVSFAYVDGRDALAVVIIRPDGGAGVVVDAHSKGMTRQDAAQVLRYVADRWDPPIERRPDES